MSVEEIENWLIDQIASELKVDRNTIDPDVSYSSMGISSSKLVFIIGDIEEKLDIEIDTDEIVDHDTIKKLATYAHSLI